MAKEIGGRCQDSLLFQCFCYYRLNCEGNIGRVEGNIGWVKGKHREGEGER